MYGEVHRDPEKSPYPSPRPIPVPRPGDEGEAPVDDVPVISLNDLGAWLSG